MWINSHFSTIDKHYVLVVFLQNIPNGQMLLLCINVKRG